MSILVGPLVRTVDELGATCEGQETDPVTYDELHIPVFEKNKKCYNVRTLSDWLSQPSQYKPGKLKNTDPMTRAPFSAEERSAIFSAAREKDPSKGNEARWDTSHLDINPQLIHELSEDLLQAVKNGNESAVVHLLSEGAAVRYENDQALRDAARMGFHTIVNRLLNAGAEVHAEDDEALRFATVLGHGAVVARLLAARADVQALHHEDILTAYENGYEDIIDMLIEAGVDRTVFE
jgi:hypothetical protein